MVVDAQKWPDTVPSISTPPPPTVQFDFCHPLCTWFCGGRGRPKKLNLPDDHTAIASSGDMPLVSIIRRSKMSRMI